MKHSIFCFVLILAISACSSDNSIQLANNSDALLASEQTWQTIQPGGETVCSDGSAYSFDVKPGEQDKLFIFLNGGGACFNLQTCDDREGNQTFVPRADLPQNNPNMHKGVFELSNPNNPLADWSIIFISYWTGDVHIGSMNQNYIADDGHEILIRHQGAANVRSALNWASENYSPDKILVAGASAGAIASPVYAGEAARIYPDAELIQYAGGGAGYRSQTVLSIMALWGVSEALPLGQYPGINLNQAMFYDFYAMQQNESTSRIRFSLYDTADDQAQNTFRSLLGDTSSLSTAIRETYADLDRRDIQVSHYLADGDTHTILRFDNFYQERVGEITFNEWFGNFLEGENSPPVDCIASDTRC